MKLSELHLYEADKRIQEFSPRTLNAYVLQNKMLMTELGDPRLDKRIPKFLIEEDIIHLKISCQSIAVDPF
jgi:hypothetical protein